MSPGFTKIDNDGVIDRLPEIDGTALKVLLVLCRRADASGACWPSVSTIGRRLIIDFLFAIRITPIASAKVVIIGRLSGTIETRMAII